MLPGVHSVVAFEMLIIDERPVLRQGISALLPRMLPLVSSFSKKFFDNSLGHRITCTLVLFWAVLISSKHSHFLCKHLWATSSPPGRQL